MGCVDGRLWYTVLTIDPPDTLQLAAQFVPELTEGWQLLIRDALEPDVEPEMGGAR